MAASKKTAKVAKKAAPKVAKKAAPKVAKKAAAAAASPGGVADYLSKLEPERRRALEVVRRFIKQHLPKGYAETLQYGMVSYVVPLKTYPTGYLGKKDVPLPYLSLAAQKGYMALYLMGLYADGALLERFTKAWKKSGKKLDMGKSCLRFRSTEELALDVLGDAIAAVPVADYVARYEQSRRR